MRNVLPLAILACTTFLLGAGVESKLHVSPDESYWTISRVTVQSASDRDSLRALIKESTPARAEVKKQGISRYWLFEQAGGNGAQVVVLTRFPSWTSIQDTTLGFTQAVYRKTMPASTKRMAWMQRLQSFLGHVSVEHSLWRETAGPDH